MLDQTQAAQAGEFVMLFVTCCILAIGLVATLWGKYQDWRYGDMSSPDVDDTAESAVAAAPQQPANAATIDCNAELFSNPLLLQTTAANLAKMVRAGKIGETEGIKLLFGVRPSSTNPRYLAARDALKAELAKLESGARYAQPDGTLGPATYPVSGRKVA